jgi:hypothetical protein
MSDRGMTLPFAVRWPRLTLTGWLFFAGVVLFVLLIWRVGTASIGLLLLAVGWWVVLLPLPHALVMLCETWGWWYAFSRDGCPLGYSTLLRFTVAAKAIQGVTPSLVQAGELLRLQLLRRAGVHPDLAAASIVMAKTTITIGELAFIVFGLAASLGTVTVTPAAATWAIVGVVGLALALAGGVAWQRRGFFYPLVGLGRRLAVLRGFLDRHAPLLASTDSMLRDYLVRHRARFHASGLAYFAAWLIGAVDAWMMLWILGLPVHATAALFIQASLTIVTRLTAFVPSNLGTLEAGTLIVFAVVGLPAEGALAFALLRRLRQLVWIAVGLGILSRESRGP